MSFNNTIFSRLLTFVSRSSFQECVDRYKGDKHSKGFSCWNQFIAMLYCQLSGKRSLREIEYGFHQHTQAHYHLNTTTIKRSTLADANNKRTSLIYQDLLTSVMNSATRQIRSKTTQAIHILDSTQIKLNDALHQWAAKGHRLFGIKMHIAYDQTDLPVYFDITNANINDVALFDKMPIQTGLTYLFDRGYYDFQAWHNIIISNAHFVTRAKNNLAYICIETLDSKQAFSDQIITLKSSKCKEIRQHKLRLITYTDEKGKSCRIVSSKMDISAQALIDLYRQRWRIETFFKWIKQNLKIKRFVGRTENAIRVQLVIAIIAYILIKLLHHCSNIKTQAQYLASAIQDSLMQRIHKKQKPPPKKQKSNSNLQLDFRL